MSAPFWTARSIGAWFVAATLLALPGCGPGVGGTGTGGAALTAFGATAASVCSSAIAIELGCAQAPGASGAGSSVGTLPLQLVDAAGRVTLDVDGNSATLASSCLKLRFDGEFGRRAAGDAFFGSFRVEGATGDVLASLAAAPAPGGGLTVELRDVDGNGVLGPVALHRATTVLPAPNGC
jgi:hypothetical protein